MANVMGFPEYEEGVIDENSANNLARDTRNKLLTASDFSQVADYPMTEEKREEWRVYRQQLRDLPEQAGWPYLDAPTAPLD